MAATARVIWLCACVRTGHVGMDAVCLLLIVPDGKESSDGRAVTHESDKH